MFGVTLPRNV